MKKSKTILFLSILATLSLITTGCGKEIEVKNGSKVAVSTKKNKYTATEYYEKIKEDNISTLIDMIDKDLLTKKYKTTDKETEEIDNQINQIKSYYGDNEENYLNVIRQYFGVESEKELREKLSLEYKRKQAAEDYVKKNIKDDEIKKYYEENIYGEIKASHILIAVDVDSNASEEEKTKAEEKAKEKAEKVISELNDGKKFETLAKKYSSDKATSNNGGDLGYFKLEDMPEDIQNALKELKNNEYTKEPVKTELGYHIIIKTGEKNKPKLKKVKEDIIDKIKTNKMNDDNTLYYVALREFRKSNKIKWNDSKLEKAYNNYMDKLIDSAKTSE